MELDADFKTAWPIRQGDLIGFQDWGMVVVFNDSGGAMSYFWRKLEKITGSVSELQLREIMVELAWLNLHLEERPTFRTECDLVNETSRIVAKRPKLNLVKMERRIRGELLYHALRHALPHMRISGRTEAEVLEAVKSGSLTLLFNDDGEFIKESLIALEQSSPHSNEELRPGSRC